MRGNFSFDDVMHTTLEYLPFVFLVTALLFSRSGLYSRREARPGFAAIVAGLRWRRSSSFAFALVNGLDFSSYYIFYGGLFFALIWVSIAALGLRARDRADAVARSGAGGARSWSGRASRSTRSRTRCRRHAPARGTSRSATSR